MGIGLTEEHEELAAYVRGFTERYVPREAVRAAVAAGTGCEERPAFWPALAEDLLGLHLPERYGGRGLSLLHLAVAVEEMGRALVPGPYVPTVLAGAVITAADAPAAHEEFLRDLARGVLAGAVCLAPATAGRSGEAASATAVLGEDAALIGRREEDGSATAGRGEEEPPTVTGRRDDGALIVTGTATPVLDGGSAGVFVLPVAAEDREIWVALHRHELGGDAMAVRALDGLDAVRGLARVSLCDAVVPPDRVLGGLTRQDVMAIATVVLGAEACGVAGWAVDAAASYARMREQFGRPIGQFQGVKHKCARMLVELEKARAAVWDAAQAVAAARAAHAPRRRTQPSAVAGQADATVRGVDDQAARGMSTDVAAGSGTDVAAMSGHETGGAAGRTTRSSSVIGDALGGRAAGEAVAGRADGPAGAAAPGTGAAGTAARDAEGSRAPDGLDGPDRANGADTERANGTDRADGPAGAAGAGVPIGEQDRCEVTAQLGYAVAVAAEVAADAAVACTQDCIQVHGGIGYTYEHDAHLYYRRALTLRALLGRASRWRAALAGLALSGVTRDLDLDLPPEAGPLRRDIRERVAELAALDGAEQIAALAAGGWVQPHLPRPWGRDASPLEQVVIDQELRAAGVRTPNLLIGAWVVPSLAAHGTPSQQERFLLPTLRGEILWCQLFSEPDAGSDLAGLRTRAVPVEGGWKISGQKIWTSLAQYAQWGICVARTDPDAPKHQGITYFLVDMASPGIDVRPLRDLTGDELFNEVFLDDVFVPDDMVVGEVNKGWNVARGTLTAERVNLSTGWQLGADLPRLLALVADLGLAGDPIVRDGVGRMAADAHVFALLGLRATLKRLSGVDVGATANVSKLVGMEHGQRLTEYGFELLGAEGALTGGKEAGLRREWTRLLLASRAMTIGGGTTEVNLNVIGERLLGLPRDAEPGG